MRCPVCGAPNGPAARFCDQCGSRLRRARSHAHGADRRIVTALFADLVDYVRMVAEHDPEEVKQRVDAALGLMGEAVRRFDGTIEKFIGDAVFAVFGHPHGHGDDALRAALAASAIRDRLARLSAGGEPLQVRIGIATGEVVAAQQPASGSPEVALTGPAIVHAARIQDLASAGEILLDEATVRAARDRLEVEDRGTAVLRGQVMPVHLYALRGELSTLRAWGPPRGRIVGRGPERRRLRAALDAVARTGRGRVVVVRGEAGMGKSRLLGDLETAARSAGFGWTWTENVSYAMNEPFRFLRVLAQALADEQGTDSGSLARQLLFTPDVPPDVVGRWAGAIAAIARDAAFSGWEAEALLAPTDPADVASAVLEVGLAYTRRAAEALGPRVIVIDDLHWADPSSTPGIDQLVRVAAELPFLVLFAALPHVAPSWIGESHVEIIDLAGLDPDETELLATEVAGGGIDPAAVTLLHERTQGNPLFVRELVRAHLDETGALRPGRLSLEASLEGSSLPLTLRALLGARIDALPADAREALQVGSVVGVVFSTSLVRELGVDGPHGAALDHLAERGLIVPLDGSESWRFAHGLIRDAAYAGLLASRRRELHSRLADRLELAGQAEIGRIARHRLAAGDRERAVPLLVRAALHAEGIGASAEAAAYWESAARIATGDDRAESWRRRAEELRSGAPGPVLAVSPEGLNAG